MSQPPIWPVARIGSPTLPQLVFLHGFLGHRQSWRAIAHALSPHYGSVLVDLPGHGGNILAEDRAPDFDTASAGLLATLDSLLLEKPILIGYSLGGRVALHFTMCSPERVHALVLESASPGLEDAAERQIRAAHDDRLAEELRQQGLTRFLENWYQQPLFSSLAGRPELLTGIMVEHSNNNANQLALAISGFSPGRMQSLWHTLPQIEIPVLLLAGALDTKYTALLNHAAALLPQSELTICPDSGHNIHAEQPTWFLKTLTQFLHHKLPH